MMQMRPIATRGTAAAAASLSRNDRYQSNHHRVSSPLSGCCWMASIHNISQISRYGRVPRSCLFKARDFSSTPSRTPYPFTPHSSTPSSASSSSMSSSFSHDEQEHTPYPLPPAYRQQQQQQQHPVSNSQEQSRITTAASTSSQSPPSFFTRYLWTLVGLACGWSFYNDVIEQNKVRPSVAVTKTDESDSSNLAQQLASGSAQLSFPTMTDKDDIFPSLAERLLPSRLFFLFSLIPSITPYHCQRLLMSLFDDPLMPTPSAFTRQYLASEEEADVNPSKSKSSIRSSFNFRYHVSMISIMFCSIIFLRNAWMVRFPGRFLPNIHRDLRFDRSSHFWYGWMAYSIYSLQEVISEAMIPRPRLYSVTADDPGPKISYLIRHLNSDTTWALFLLPFIAPLATRTKYRLIYFLAISKFQR